MHLQVILRGINTQVELWKIMAQAQFFLWTRKDLKTGKDFNNLYQMGLRPSVWGTWEIIIPEECLPTLLSMIGVTDSNKWVDGISMSGMKMSILRKMCGVKKIPKKIFEEAAKIPCSIELKNSMRGLSHLQTKGVVVHVIGYKKDEYGEMDDPANGKRYYQELL